MGYLNWIAQILGILGTLIALSCFHWNKRRNVLLNKLLMDVIWGIHYLLLGAYAGFFANLICLLRELIFLNNDKKLFQNRIWLPLFVMCNWLCAAFTWNGLFSLLPALASSFATYSFWQKKVKTTRAIALVNNGIMLTYDLCVSSYTGMLNEALAFLSTLFAVFLHKNKPDGKEEQEG